MTGPRMRFRPGKAPAIQKVTAEDVATPCPPIRVYECRDSDCPEPQRFVAWFYKVVKTKEGVVLDKRYPVFFTSDTHAGAVAKAEMFWAEEQRKLAQREVALVSGRIAAKEALLRKAALEGSA